MCLDWFLKSQIISNKRVYDRKFFVVANISDFGRNSPKCGKIISWNANFWVQLGQNLGKNCHLLVVSSNIFSNSEIETIITLAPKFLVRTQLSHKLCKIIF